jgi:hypothetical protein
MPNQHMKHALCAEGATPRSVKIRLLETRQLMLDKGLQSQKGG